MLAIGRSDHGLTILTERLLLKCFKPTKGRPRNLRSANQREYVK